MELWLCLRSRSAASAAYQAPVVVPVPVYTRGLDSTSVSMAATASGSRHREASSVMPFQRLITTRMGGWAASWRAHRYRMAIRC
jgi:hypothetical protein